MRLPTRDSLQGIPFKGFFTKIDELILPMRQRLDCEGSESYEKHCVPYSQLLPAPANHVVGVHIADQLSVLSCELLRTALFREILV